MISKEIFSVFHSLLMYRLSCAKKNIISFSVLNVVWSWTVKMPIMRIWWCLGGWFVSELFCCIQHFNWLRHEHETKQHKNSNLSRRRNYFSSWENDDELRIFLAQLTDYYFFMILSDSLRFKLDFLWVTKCCLLSSTFVSII